MRPVIEERWRCWRCCTLYDSEESAATCCVCARCGATAKETLWANRRLCTACQDKLSAQRVQWVPASKVDYFIRDEYDAEQHFDSYDDAADTDEDGNEEHEVWEAGVLDFPFIDASDIIADHCSDWGESALDGVDVTGLQELLSAWREKQSCVIYPTGRRVVRDEDAIEIITAMVAGLRAMSPPPPTTEVCHDECRSNPHRESQAHRAPGD